VTAAAADAVWPSLPVIPAQHMYMNVVNNWHAGVQQYHRRPVLTLNSNWLCQWQQAIYDPSTNF